MTFTPPNNILRTSDGIELELTSTVPKSKLMPTEQYTYKYLNGLLKGGSINYSEEEIKKQLTNYWKEIK